MSKLSVVVALLLSACATRPPVVAEAPLPPPAPMPAPPPMPAGGVPGLVLPARLADGGWPTPSRGVGGGVLSADGAAWHLRGGLNVAAIACRDEALVTAYNGFLAARRPELAAIETRYAAEWKANAAGDWRDAYDDAMTRLYNFYGQSLARPGFCAVAAETLAALAVQPATPLPAVAAARLAALDRPFTDFFAAYDAWRSGQAAPVQVAALSAPAPVVGPMVANVGAPVVAVAAPVAVVPAAPAKPVLLVDPAIFTLP